MVSKNAEIFCQTLFDLVELRMIHLDFSKLIWNGFEVWPLIVYFNSSIILIFKNTKNCFFPSKFHFASVYYCLTLIPFIFGQCTLLISFEFQFMYILILILLHLFLFDQWVNDWWLALTYEGLNLLWFKSNSSWSKINWMALH